MKFNILLCDPDGINDSIEKAIDEEFGKDIDDDTFNKKLKEIRQVTDQWIDNGLTVLIEVDTDAKTTTLMNKESIERYWETND